MDCVIVARKLSCGLRLLALACSSLFVLLASSIYARLISSFTLGMCCTCVLLHCSLNKLFDYGAGISNSKKKKKKKEEEDVESKVTKYSKVKIKVLLRFFSFLLII